MFVPVVERGVIMKDLVILKHVIFADRQDIAEQVIPVLSAAERDTMQVHVPLATTAVQHRTQHKDIQYVSTVEVATTPLLVSIAVHSPMKAGHIQHAHGADKRHIHLTDTMNTSLHTNI